MKKFIEISISVSVNRKPIFKMGFFFIGFKIYKIHETFFTKDSSNE